MKKAQFEFAWIFAAIVGAVILFFAFYFVGTRLLSQKQEEATIEAQSLDILLNPFSHFGEIAKASAALLALQQAYELNVECNNDGLGYNEITLSRKGAKGISRVVRDKYIFVENTTTKKFQALAMPFEMPWRVADIIILWPYEKKYCFVGAPSFIKETLGNTTTGLNISSIIFVDNQRGCPENATTVCFTQRGCDVNINIQQNITTKAGRSIYFAGEALLYASIFSDPEIYNCNVKRLASRLKIQTRIYREKAIGLSRKGCSANFNLEQLGNSANSLSETLTQNNINDLWEAAQQLKRQNEIADCALF